MDAGGNLYGTTRGATAYKLSARHNWVLSLLYSFTFGADGYDPQSGVVFGPDGTLFGTIMKAESRIVWPAAAPFSI